MDVTIKSITTLNTDAAAGGSVYDAWCLAQNISIPTPYTYTTYLYSSYELGTLATSVPALASSSYLANLDNINWLLNWYNGSNAVYGDVQGAIWKMMGNTYIDKGAGPQNAANIDALVTQAIAHDGYVPEVGGKIAGVLDTAYVAASGAITHYQPLLITLQAASIGDRVWHDMNANGIQDAGEAGIAGATVTLVRDLDGDNKFTSPNEVLATTTTDSTGHYLFKGLTPGLNYQVVFSLPSSYDSISPRQIDAKATPGLNSDALVSDIVVLANGENNTTLDAGFYNKASLGDRLWLDANGNGQQDAGEAGVAGDTVTLIGGGADGLISTTADNTLVTTTTDADGKYAFTGLTPGVEYQVQFSAPAGSVFTAQDKGADASDSDASNAGLSQIVKLTSGETNNTIDAGVYTPAALGDRVWIDANANGQQDAGEAGVAGATVTLIGGGADGLVSTTADNTTVTTTTDTDGKYAFTGLTPGVEYQVQFSAPSGSVFTAQDKGAD
ncbi:MAG: SdrD B-like domain-containing protein, partial [Telluria sp.]